MVTVYVSISTKTDVLNHRKRYEFMFKTTIHELRREIRMTQDELAQRVGVRRETI